MNFPQENKPFDDDSSEQDSQKISKLTEKKVPIYIVIVAVVLSVVITFQITSVALSLSYKKALDESIPDYFASALTIDEYFRKYFIGEIDEQTLSEYLAYAYLYASGDKYAYYYTAEEYEAEMLYYDGSSVGIGIRVYNSEADGGIKVLRVMSDSPAEKAGLLEGDVILSVEGTVYGDVSYSELVDLIQGKVDTKVALTVRRGDETLELQATRGEYELENVEYHIYKDGQTEKKIGFIRVFSFTSNTVTQFKAALNALEDAGVEALVFDMRENTGGELQSVIDMLDMLLPEGPIVRINDRDGNTVKTYTSDENCVDLPMAVLTNSNTASAAELFTAALIDYEMAVSVGTTTYGKGTVQRFVTLADGSAFKFSYRYYSPPFSDNFNGVGIEPYIEVEIDENTVIYTLTDEDDVQLEAAVGYLLNK